MTGRQARTGNPKIDRWRIIFITDIHGHLDGFGADAAHRYGGLGKISWLINNLRPEPDRKMLLCLGGDIVRSHTHRLLHNESVAGVWDNILKELAPDVIVLGNHELKDFGAGFALHVIQGTAGPKENSGCTRNVEWSDANRRDGKPCNAKKGAGLPPSSGHSLHTGRSGKELLFVGLVDWDGRGNEDNKLATDLEGCGYRIRKSSDTIVQVLVPYCFNEAECAKDRLVVFVAHCDGKLPPNTNPENDFLKAYGANWARGDPWLTRGRSKTAAHPKGKEWHCPHFILKGHDHNATIHPREQPVTGFIPWARGCDKLQGSRVAANDASVPTFSSGADGEAFGILDLCLREEGVEYSWETRRTGETQHWCWGFGASTQPTWHGMWCKAGVNFKEFGHDDTDASYLAHSMDLLLRALLHTDSSGGDGTCLAVASAGSVRPHSLVPGPLTPKWCIKPEDARPFLTPDDHKQLSAATDPMASRSVIEQAWRRKIDKWDITHVYGNDSSPTVTVKLKGTVDFVRGVTKAFRKPGVPLLPTLLPDVKGPSDRGAEPVRKGAFFSPQSIWIMRKTEIYVCAMPVGRAEIGIYRLDFNPAMHRTSRFSLRFCTWLSESAIEELLEPQREMLVYTTQFTVRKLTGWGRTARQGNLSVCNSVLGYLDNLDLASPELPYMFVV